MFAPDYSSDILLPGKAPQMLNNKDYKDNSRPWKERLLSCRILYYSTAIFCYSSIAGSLPESKHHRTG